MKLKYYIPMAATGIFFSAVMAGCSIFDKSSKHIVYGSEGKVTDERVAIVPEGTALTPRKDVGTSGKESSTYSVAGSKAVKNTKRKGGDAGKSGVSQKELAEARKGMGRNDGAGVDADAVSSDDSSECRNQGTGNATVSSDFSINGEWTIYSVRGNIVTGEERPYVNFDLSAKRFYGTNGCNYINGDLAVGANQALTMDNMIASMKMCQDAPFEYLINLAISDVRSYVPRQEGTVTFLDLKSADGRTVLVLRRHNMDFLNGAWKITDINGTRLTPVAGEDEATMTINITDMKIHGTTGCNIFNGELFIDPDKVDSMQFINIATTRMGCPPGSHETEFLLGLECVETARLLGNDMIAMYDNDGKEIFKMTRLDLSQVEAD